MSHARNPYRSHSRTAEGGRLTRKTIAALLLAVMVTLTPTLAHAATPPRPQPPSTLPALFADRPVSKDPRMTGEQLPYRGKFWRASQAAWTRCVLRRETNLHWHSTDRANGYFGAFQFSQPLTVGATWMMTPELKAMYGPKIGRQIARALRATEMHRWLPYWQHMALLTVLNWTHPYSGASHWAGGRWHCAR